MHMIIGWEELPNFAGKVTMVDGSFDPLHEGHIAYFSAAAELGKPVLCNVANDAWTSAKHPILLPQSSRARVIDSIRYVSYVHASNHSTLDVLRRLKPSAYVKGVDWLSRGGVPTGELDACRSMGVEVIYVDTVLNSSSKILERFLSE